MTLAAGVPEASPSLPDDERRCLRTLSSGTRLGLEVSGVRSILYSMNGDVESWMGDQ